ncbi:MAG: response regulator, partial [Candidatus Methanoplasma sp.]|nr:response regulator [Candidatus Methanoplasma sp.]
MYKVLVISSDSALLSNAKRFITNVNSSISVETLEDTSEIKDRLNTANYIDVVICDHNPPAIDAISVFNDLTRMNDLRPFIIMTNKADGNVAIRAFELRMDYYLSRENVTNFYMDLSSKRVLCAERRRLELDRILNEKRMKALMNLVMMREKEFREILNYALEESVTLTNSTMGYIATYDDDSKNLKMEAWSRGGLDRCQMKTHPIIYDF